MIGSIKIAFADIAMQNAAHDADQRVGHHGKAKIGGVGVIYGTAILKGALKKAFSVNVIYVVVAPQ